MPNRRSPLLDTHRRLGAKLTDFAGWEMPLQYAGVVAEHRAVRSSAGLFDVSHLGKLWVEGSGSTDALARSLTADLSRLDLGRAGYGLVLAEDAGCVDDVFVYHVDDDAWLVVPNAANVGSVADCIRASGGEVVDLWERWAILALQGPDSFELFEQAWPGTGATRLGLHHWMAIEGLGPRGFCARTGYTGERGFELYVAAEAAAAVFNRLLELGCEPAGLGARDTLRLEMGYALYGHELTRDINPLEAGLGWAIAWEQPFRGRDALESVRRSGPARRLFGVRCTGRGVPRRGYPVRRGDAVVGEVTSGNYSPTLETGIALALGPAADVPEPGERVDIEGRGRRIEGAIVKPPFVGSQAG